ncbi:MAG: PadR family transcriptional regulator [Gemmatimonadaceae bacterium]
MTALTAADSPRQLLKGTLDVLVLKALSWGPMHGFAVASWLEQRSEGILGVEDSALYQALHRMEERGLIEAEWGITDKNRKARFYRLTAAGRKHLRTEMSSWMEYAGAVTRILRSATQLA